MMVPDGLSEDGYIIFFHHRWDKVQQDSMRRDGLGVQISKIYYLELSGKSKR